MAYYSVILCNFDILVMNSYEYGYIQYQNVMGWTYRSWGDNSYTTLPNISKDITEAEVFQLNLVWEYKLPLEHYIQISRMFYNNEFKEEQKVSITG